MPEHKQCKQDLNCLADKWYFLLSWPILWHYLSGFFFPVYDLLFVLLHFKAVFCNFRQLLELSSSGPCMLCLIKLYTGFKRWSLDIKDCIKWHRADLRFHMMCFFLFWSQLNAAKQWSALTNKLRWLLSNSVHIQGIIFCYKTEILQ